MTGRLTILGLGPFGPDQTTPEAATALSEADEVFGYATYLARVTPRAGQKLHASDNREEIDRARAALVAASQGHRVVVVSSGDPGVFAMASAVFEAIDTGEPAWRSLDVVVLPGVTAMLAAAARFGAPFGHDFCAINLSDNLKPWSLVEQRLAAAAGAGFAIALYNPVSKARPSQLTAAFRLLSSHLAPETLVMFARAVGDKVHEHLQVSTLREAPEQQADMRTIVLIGTASTRSIERPSGRPFIYTLRHAL